MQHRLKHPETIKGNVKNLGKRIKRKDKDLSKPLIAKKNSILHVGGV
jgi:hypothetical protein